MTTPNSRGGRSDAELNALVGELLAGWRFSPSHNAERKAEAVMCWIKPGNPDHCLSCLPNFVNDSNAVLPLLEQYWEACRTPDGYGVKIHNAIGEVLGAATAQTFPRAAVLALLKSRGIDV